MSLAVFKVMLLGLLRDRGALIMTFLVPALFFLIIASIFTASSGGEFAPRVAVLDVSGSEAAETLIETLRDQPTLNLVELPEPTPEGVRAQVRRGTADVGLVIRSDDFGLSSGHPESPLLVLRDPSRAVADDILSAQIQRALVPKAPRSGESTQAATPELFERENVAGESAGLNKIAYSAGAVGVLFLLFAAVNAAVTLFDEQQSGIIERIVAGPGSTRVLVNGKFLYLLCLGFVQMGVIFLVAWLVHGVDLPGHLLSWTVVTLVASAAAAGVALAITTACSTRRQAQNLGSVAMLVLSALGGSMVPRFIMPELLQDIGWFTPNAWAIEAYTSIFWREEPPTALILPLSLLAATALVGLGIGQLLSRRLASL
jgi:ABC-2 type transport system permease protein